MPTPTTAHTTTKPTTTPRSTTKAPAITTTTTSTALKTNSHVTATNANTATTATTAAMRTALDTTTSTTTLETTSLVALETPPDTTTLAVTISTAPVGLVHVTTGVSSTHGSSSDTGLIVGVVIGALLTIGLVVGLVIYLTKFRTSVGGGGALKGEPQPQYGQVPRIHGQPVVVAQYVTGPVHGGGPYPDPSSAWGIVSSVRGDVRLRSAAWRVDGEHGIDRERVGSISYCARCQLASIQRACMATTARACYALRGVQRVP
jgi:hypothetical protein